MEMTEFILKQGEELENYIESFIEQLQAEIKSQQRNTINGLSIYPENRKLVQELSNRIECQLFSYTNQLREIPDLVVEFNCKLLNYISCISSIKTMNLKKQKLIEAIMLVKKDKKTIMVELENCNAEIHNCKIKYDINTLKENENLAKIFHNKQVSYLELIETNDFVNDCMNDFIKKEFYEFINTQPTVFYKLQYKEYTISKLNIKKSFLYYRKNKIKSYLNRLYILNNDINCEKEKIINKKNQLYCELNDLIYNSDSYLFKQMLSGIIKNNGEIVYSKDVKVWLAGLAKK